ncbi:MAG: hypothetical protein U1E17_00275 [Geminicoccaceae bacterium]
MADATDTRSTLGAQCESARQHPDDEPYGPFEVGENASTVKRWHEQDASFASSILDRMHFASEMAASVCTSLDGIAAKLEYVLGQRIADIAAVAHEELAVARQTVEIMALATSLIDLYRIRRIGAEARS